MASLWPDPKTTLPCPSRPQRRIIVFRRADDFLDAVLGDEVAAGRAALDAELGEVEWADEVFHAQAGFQMH